MRTNSKRGGVTTSIEARLTRPALASGVRVSDARLTVELTDGREVSIPLTEFPELAAATPEQRANWTITALGTAIYWPDIDEEAAWPACSASPNRRWKKRPDSKHTISGRWRINALRSVGARLV